MNNFYKNIISSVLITLIIVFLSSLLLGLPYIYTLLIISAWVAFGHLFTLDDDMPEGWSNMDSEPKIWKRSKIELSIKFLVFLFLLFLIYKFPSMTRFGS